MADNQNQIPESDRTVRLSEVEFVPKNYADANITVEERGYVAKASRNGSKLVSQTGVAQGTGAAPTHLQVVKSEKDPTEFVLVPTNDESADYIKLDWIDRGRFVRFHMGKLLKLKKMEIPKGTRLVANIFPETDSKYGNVVGILLNEVDYVPVEAKSKAKPETLPAAGADAEQEPPASA